MKRHLQIQKILKTRFIAIIRAQSPDQLIDVGWALQEGGCDLIEVTMTTPGALDVIEKAAVAFGDKVLVGVGSVIDSETARAAILKGAQYIVSPITDYDTIDMAHRYDKVIMPGAYTPTEAFNAYRAGADFVKIFPAGTGGPGFIKSIKAPLPQLSLVPTGGVNLDTIEDFINAGADACGVGSALVSKEALADGDMERIKQTAAAFLKKIQQVTATK